MSVALIAGGGTGGHLSIAIAIAQAMKELAPEERVVLLGCRMETDEPMLKESGFPFHVIPTRPWPRGPRWVRFGHYVWDALLGLGTTLWAVGRAVAVLRRERPRVVIGTGGYGSVPALVAAWILRLPTLIHEADSVVGLANHFLARFAEIITLGYGDAAGPWCSRRATVTGNPVRRGFSILKRAEARRALQISPAGRLIVAFGGSQGARSINHAVLGAAEALLENEEACLLHVSGRRDYGEMREKVERMGGSLRGRYRLHPFLQEREMVTALVAADVVVTRAGASALAEVAATGTPAVIIPYPFARQEHQASNAKSMVERGQAVLLDDAKLNPLALIAAIEGIRGAGERRVNQRAGNAAKEIASLALRLAERRLALRGAMG